MISSTGTEMAFVHHEAFNCIDAEPQSYPHTFNLWAENMLRRAEAFQRPLMLRRPSHAAAYAHPLGSMATPIIGARPAFDPF